MGKIKSITYEAFYNVQSKLFLIVNDVLAFFTILSVVGVVLETVESLQKYSYVFLAIEYVSVAIFTIEYIGRIIAAQKKSSYIFSFFGIIDLLAILPTLIGFTNFTFLKSARILRIMRFLRMLRLAKLMRLKSVHKKDLEEYSEIYRINVKIYFLTLFTAIVIFASLIYVAEGHTQNEFKNIPISMIWASKVIMGGVPEAIPKTIAGNIITIMARFTGLILFGLLINIVGMSVKKILFGSEEIIPQQKNKI